MRKRCCVIVFIAILYSTPVYHVNAIPMFYGSGFGSHGMWTRFLDTNTSILFGGSDFLHDPWEAEDIHQLADHGIKINLGIGWWTPFFNGQIAWNTSVVDFYYNASLIEMLEQEIDWQLSYLDPDKIWAATISSEEPSQGAYRYFWTPETFRKYNDTYHSETGFWLREGGLNKTEEIVLDEWLAEKFVWLFNHVYDYVKGKWPHLLIFQFTSLWPGAPPVWVGGIEAGDLKADGYMADLYFYDVYDNPFWLYEFVRQTKSTFPDREYHLWLWGEEAWAKAGLAGGFEHMRRNAWVAYLAGVDVIGWFNWHYIHGNIWQREDALGKRLYMYTNRLNNELSKLPPMEPRPQVLVIRDQMMSFQVGLCCDLGLYNEWDAISQRAFAKKELDLSQYKLIIVNEDRYLDEAVEKLNEYIRSGGNLILLGGFGREQRNFYDNATRTSKFVIEEGVRQEHIGGDINLDISDPNPLGLNLQCKLLDSSMLAIAKATLTKNHHPIGEFHFVDENGKLTQMEHCPLVLYHNSSNPDEGSILYWGIPSGTPILGSPHVEDVVEAFLPEWNYTRFLYREITRGFARDYLHINGSLAVSGTENMIITQSEIEDGVILAGISNYYPQTVNINYTLDLDNFDLPMGEYWVHSLDRNLTLGPFESQQSLLEIPLTVVANGTRLLLISQGEIAPSYSVNVFPEIPTAEEVEDLWSKGIPSASFTYSPTEPSPMDSVSFADTSTDLDGTIVSWFWDFGDYSERWWSIEQDPTHQFSEEGEYTVSLTVTDNNGCSNVRQQTITIQIPPPTASFTYSPSSPTVGQVVSFTDVSTIPEGRTIASWSWNFGDGDTSTVQNPTHKYDDPGSYTATLTLEDSEGLEDTYSTIIEVRSDYTVYYVIGSLLLVAVIAVAIFMLTKRKK